VRKERAALGYSHIPIYPPRSLRVVKTTSVCIFQKMTVARHKTMRKDGGGRRNSGRNNRQREENREELISLEKAYEMYREERNNVEGTKLKEDIHSLTEHVSKLACDINEIQNKSATKHDVSQTLTETHQNYFIN